MRVYQLFLALLCLAEGATNPTGGDKTPTASANAGKRKKELPSEEKEAEFEAVQSNFVDEVLAAKIETASYRTVIELLREAKNIRQNWCLRYEVDCEETGRWWERLKELRERENVSKTRVEDFMATGDPESLEDVGKLILECRAMKKIHRDKTAPSRKLLDRFEESLLWMREEKKAKAFDLANEMQEMDLDVQVANYLDNEALDFLEGTIGRLDELFAQGKALLDSYIGMHHDELNKRVEEIAKLIRLYHVNLQGALDDIIEIYGHAQTPKLNLEGIAAVQEFLKAQELANYEQLCGPLKVKATQALADFTDELVLRHLEKITDMNLVREAHKLLPDNKVIAQHVAAIKVNQQAGDLIKYLERLHIESRQLFEKDHQHTQAELNNVMKVDL